MGKKLENVARWNSISHKQKTGFYKKKMMMLRRLPRWKELRFSNT